MSASARKKLRGFLKADREFPTGKRQLADVEVASPSEAYAALKKASDFCHVVALSKGEDLAARLILADEAGATAEAVRRLRLLWDGDSRPSSD